MIPVRVRGLVVDERSKSPIVVLQEEEGERILPIWIGEAEARSIGMAMAGEALERPLTHDLLVSLIKGLRASVSSIAITDLRDNTFFAEIRLEHDGEQVLLDARPSDSIAVALRTGAQILVAESVMSTGQTTGLPSRKAEPSDAQRLAELRKRLEDMDPRDFGKTEL